MFQVAIILSFVLNSLFAAELPNESEVLKQLIEGAPSPVPHPRAILTSGPIGAGKTSFLKRLEAEAGLNLKNYLYISADDIYLKFPQSKAILARLAQDPANKSAAEDQAALYNLARSVSWELIDFAISRGINFVFDSAMLSGAREHLSYLIKEADKKIFTSLIYIEADSTETLISRMLARAGPEGEEPGRYVPQSLIRTMNEGLGNKPDDKAKFFNEYFHLSNNKRLILMSARHSKKSELAKCIRTLTEISEAKP